MKDIDYTIKNQIIKWDEDAIVITSGEVEDPYGMLHFAGHCIIIRHSDHHGFYYQNKNHKYRPGSNKILLPTLPPSLNFYIYEHEWY